jgi:transcriptional regulator with GAF, ATPase, and Fis domain
VVLDLPPLRQRREDVPALAEGILRRDEPGRAWRVSVGVRRLLLSPTIEWSGNVRQLERVIRRARDRARLRDPEASELVPEHFESRDLDGVSPARASGAAPSVAPLADSIAVRWQQLQADRARNDETEQELMRRALAEANGVVSQAARSLGVARTTFQSRIDALDMRSRTKREP